MPAHDPQPVKWDVATEQLWKTLESINEWTRFADAKAAAILTANGVFATIVASFDKDKWAPFTGHPYLEIEALLCALALLVSSGFCIKCIYPKTSLKGMGNPDSLLFFHHIALRKGKAEYLVEAESLARSDVAFREVASQVWANAKVCREKHKEVGRAIWLTGASLVGSALIFAYIKRAVILALFHA